MPRPLHLLLAEDDPHDAELLVSTLRAAGFDPQWKRVDNEADFVASLADDIDIVLSDFGMQSFNGLRALDLLIESGRDIPFILISGTIGEEKAVAAMKRGAADYLLKDRLGRLGPAIEQAIEQSRLRRERNATEDALRRAGAHLNQLVARSPTVIYSVRLTETQAVLNYVSPNITFLTGFTAAEALQPDWWSNRLHPEDRDAAVASFRITMEQGLGRTEYRVSCKDGRYVWLEDRKRLLPGQNGDAREIVGGWTDITVRKEAEDARRRAEARYQSIFDNAVDGIYQSTPEGKYVTVNPAMARICGYDTPEELIRNVTNISTQLYVNPQRRADFQRSLKEKNIVLGFEAQMLRADGSVIWTSTNARAMRDETGELLYEGIVEDITERKQLEEKFLRMQRVEAIGTLASGLAHDLNNILVPMLMAAGMLKEKLTDRTDREILLMVENSAQRGANIIGQLLNFSRGADGERVCVQPKHLIKEIIQIMRETFPRNIEIAQDIPANLWNVVADPTQFHQVLMNLCVNARDAMEHGGTLSLVASNLDLGEAEAARHADAKPGPYVVVTIRDTGAGIAPELMPRIFDPFFTTKPLGKGTGLGLSTVSSIVKTHGGFVTVESRPGDGTIFAVRFPATVEKTVESQKGSEQPVPGGKGELILVVDDEANIQELLRRSLEKNHYHVLTAANGEEAIRIFVQNRGRIRLVLTDILMPGMDGLALIRALRLLEPGIKIIACSGQNQNDKRPELAAFGVVDLLAKPFSTVYLLKMLHRALDENGDETNRETESAAGPAKQEGKKTS